MTNAISILSTKRQKLITLKADYKREYESRIHDIDLEIEHINDALNVIEQAAAPYKCKHCGGTGTIYGTDAADSRDEEVCRYCHGTGIDISTKEGM